MRRAWMGLAAVGLVALGFGAGTVFSQDMGGEKKAGDGAAPPGMPTPEEMAAMMKAGTPGEQHKRIASLDGEWTVTGKHYMGPGAPATEFSGTATNKMVLGGRYQHQEFKSEFMGMPFEGFGLSGFDNMTGEYFSIWTDNMSTMAMMTRGKADETGKITFTGECDDPTGGRMTMRMVEHPAKDGVFHFEMFNKCKKYPDEFKCMEMNYTKKK